MKQLLFYIDIIECEYRKIIHSKTNNQNVSIMLSTFLQLLPEKK